MLRCGYIDAARADQRRWDAEMEGLLAQPAPPERPLVNGADVAAGMLSAML